MKIILASKSPRRLELMHQIGLEVGVIPSTVEEVITKTIPSDVVEELSLQKAEDVAQMCRKNNDSEPCIVIGADTVVSVDHRILGKPKNGEDAADMLRTLQGRTHTVYTGVTCILLSSDSGSESENRDNSKLTTADQCPIAGGWTVLEKETFSVGTDVTFFSMSDEEIHAYIASGDPMDKAGAYGIQGEFAKFVRGIHGDYNNVVGLPVSAVYQRIKHWL